MAIYGVLLALMLVMRFAPASPIGRALNRQLVEVPLRVLGGMQRHHLIFLIVMAALLVAGSEVILALGSMDFAVLYALDVSLYVDGLLMTLALASVARTRSAITLLGGRAMLLATRIRRGFGGRRMRRGPARRATGKPSNDDDHPAFALAA